MRPSAASARLQPASELGHLRRHEHDRHVSGALHPAPRPPNLQLHARSPLHAACAPRSLAASRLPARSPYAARPARTPCLRPSAESVRLQPAAQLGHLRRHRHEQHVSSALLTTSCPPICGPSPLHCTLLVHRDRSPPPAPRSAARPAPFVPRFRPSWQGTRAFNQPLSWDTSGVTDMSNMFAVRCPRALAPLSAVVTPPPLTMRAHAV